MASNWDQVRVADLLANGALAINDGYRVRNVELGREGIPFVRGGDIGDGTINFDVEDRIRPQYTERVRSKLTRPYDVAFITKGTVGRVGLVRPNQPEGVFAPQVCYWRSLDWEVVDPRFLYYLLTSAEFQANLDAVKTHGSMVADYVSMTDQKNFRLTFPPIRNQRAIGRLLGALDDKIELNRRMNATLEGISRAIFKSWFVDFDPVRQKVAGKQPVGMDARTAALFPDSFEDSDVGEVPKGWGGGVVGDSYDITMGQSPPGDTYNESGDGLPFFQGRADFSFRYPERRVFCTAPTRFAAPGDTLVSVRAPVGDINMALERCAVGRGVAAVRHKTGAIGFTYYGMHALSSMFEKFEGEGTVFGSMGKKDFHGIKAVAPAEDLIHAFEHAIAPQNKQIENLERQTANLTALRDALLPKLLSGEVRVPEAEGIVEEAV